MRVNLDHSEIASHATLILTAMLIGAMCGIITFY